MQNSDEQEAAGGSENDRDSEYLCGIFPLNYCTGIFNIYDYVK